MKLKFKVTHIFYSGLGGHANVFFSLLKADKLSLYDSNVILYGIEDPLKEYIINFEKYNITYTFVRKKKGMDIFFWLKIFQNIRKIRPNRIFLHGSYNIIPSFVYSVFNKTKIIVRETQANHLKTKLEWILLYLSVFLSDYLVFLSKAYHTELINNSPNIFINRKIRIIPNGIDLTFYKPNKMINIDKRFMRIGMISRVVPIKDHITLLKAFSKLVTKNSNLILRIAGDGTELENLKELSQKLKIQKNVEFLGTITQSEIPEFLNSLDIYVHATFGETMSTSIMQAQACGLPIVGTNVKGVKNIIKHNENGLLYELEDALDLETQLITLLTSKEKMEKFSLASIQYAKEKLSNENMFKEYVKILS
ncbi:glycosyltransferase family 4 protein [Flammeovirga sp. SJP92]|uniref:glycosyltransferase family 4 protein n=1 Tax=Flammeovirga sp. SJP92 TaxID=1775430 RepID=UPI0007871BA0|nr:glycosyltransferase family 4 protein [Flammeovirga sp. SJP92]KXX70408.1 hypothetical protein AVL50_09005 [Flammeovirga sp. SJP92]